MKKRKSCRTVGSSFRRLTLLQQVAFPCRKQKRLKKKTLKGDQEVGQFYFKNYIFEDKCEHIISNKANPAKME